MAYIGQGIREGTFSVLDTSGNTYNGSNVTFSLGTQVGSPAQLLVSHDGVIQKPGTDYSLATGGTQITFSTAPASGASIFIVEISGAVGGPLDSDLNGTELILDADADTSITADTDDQIDIKIAGADDFQFTANTFTAASGSSIVVPDGGLTFGSTAISSTAAELNLLDGGTSVGSSITLADADGIVVNDGGTMKTIPASDVKTYAGGLHVLISATDLPSEGTSFTIDNCFSDTYDKYLIFGERFRTGTNQSNVKIKLRTGGGSGSDAGNNLGGAYQGRRHDGADVDGSIVNAGDATIVSNAYNDTEFHFMMHVFYPTNTGVNTVVQGKSTFREGSTSYSAFTDFGYLSISTEDHTGFVITSSSGNFNSTACRLSVYGITDGA
jgi:hypothetical protein